MSDKDIKDSNIDMDLADAEFDTFLQGGDELALLLQDLPQDTPSTELDAAIMADAVAALTATSSKPAVAPVTDAALTSVVEPVAGHMVTAANDAQNPEASRHRPSFLWRWKTPLGLAASVMLAVPLFFSHQEHEAEIEAANTGPVSAKIFYPQEVKNKEIAPVPAVAEMSQAAPMPQRQPDTERDKEPNTERKIAAKDVAAESSVKSERRADGAMKPAPVIVADKATKPVLAAPPMPVIASPAPVVIAEAPPPAPKAAVAAIIANEKMPEVVRAAEAERARNTESYKIAAREEASRHLAKVADAEGRLQAAAPPGMARSAAAPAPAAAPVNATPPAPRATMDSMVADKKLDMQDNSPARVIVPLPLQALAPLPPAQLPDAPDWLAKIEKLLKEKQHQEALEEWKKFRTTYPNFVVDKSLQKQIDTLQK